MSWNFQPDLQTVFVKKWDSLPLIAYATQTFLSKFANSSTSKSCMLQTVCKAVKMMLFIEIKCIQILTELDSTEEKRTKKKKEKKMPEM